MYTYTYIGIGIKYKDTIQGYNTRIQYKDTLQEYNTWKQRVQHRNIIQRCRYTIGIQKNKNTEKETHGYTIKEYNTVRQKIQYRDTRIQGIQSHNTDLHG